MNLINTKNFLYLRARYIKQFTFYGGTKAALSRKKNKLLYDNRKHNFGDILNVELMRYFDIDFVQAPPLNANMSCIGSLLDRFIKRPEDNVSTKTTIVFGSGFLRPPKNSTSEQFNRNVDIIALRGKISQQRCAAALRQNLDDVVLGDPGLLVRRIFRNIDTEKAYDVGIICHYADKKAGAIKNIKLDGLKTTFIDIQSGPESFAKAVASCKFILSSAMHGLICADSLGVPNQHVILSTKLAGGEYKFRDYYSVFPNHNYAPVYLENAAITPKDIEQYKTQYSITNQEVETICDKLENAFTTARQKGAI